MMHVQHTTNAWLKSLPKVDLFLKVFYEFCFS
jgi:dynein heavy chain 1